MKYIAILFLCSLFNAQIPEYYSGIDFSDSPENIKNNLSVLITQTNTTNLEYTPEVWDALRISDLNSATDDVLLIYGYNDTDVITKNDRLRDKSLSCHTSSCIGLWNREHVFAKSWTSPSMDTDNPGIATDAHNLRACDSQMNSSRSNKNFIESTGTAHSVSSSSFYPGDEWKGDIARIIMFMRLRYADLCDANIAANSENNYSIEMPDIFLQWNAEDPVSAVEILRNNEIENKQGNRNPFIDNPYLATLIWNGPEAIDTWDLLQVIEVELELSNLIYPNPVNETLFIKENIISTQVINADGIQMFESKQKEIDVKFLETGIYFIKIKMMDGSVVTNKFIKN